MERLEKMFGIEIGTCENFQRALTHPSFTKEKNLDYTECYERLEFLGDAVLKLAVSDILFEIYPNEPEGKLSKIRSIVVSDAMLSNVAREIGFPDLLIIAKHEEKQGCRNLESVIACAFEAVLGAYYLDGKFNQVKNFIKEKFNTYIKDIDIHEEKYNAKAVLQEYTQGKAKLPPVYNVVKEEGPEHNKTFYVEVSFENEILGKGEGKTKKEAEQQAALKACKELGIIE